MPARLRCSRSRRSEGVLLIADTVAETDPTGLVCRDVPLENGTGVAKSWH